MSNISKVNGGNCNIEHLRYIEHCSTIFNSMLQCSMLPKWFICKRGIHIVGRHGVV